VAKSKIILKNRLSSLYTEDHSLGTLGTHSLLTRHTPLAVETINDRAGLSCQRARTDLDAARRRLNGNFLAPHRRWYIVVINHALCKPRHADEAGAWISSLLVIRGRHSWRCLINLDLAFEIQPARVVGGISLIGDYTWTGGSIIKETSESRHAVISAIHYRRRECE